MFLSFVSVQIATALPWCFHGVTMELPLVFSRSKLESHWPHGANRALRCIANQPKLRVFFLDSLSDEKVLFLFESLSRHFAKVYQGRERMSGRNQGVNWDSCCHSWLAVSGGLCEAAGQQHKIYNLWQIWLRVTEIERFIDYNQRITQTWNRSLDHISTKTALVLYFKTLCSTDQQAEAKLLKDKNTCKSCCPHWSVCGPEA